MAGLTNLRPYINQTVEVGFVIVTADSNGGMVDIHDRRPVVLTSQDAWRRMDSATQVEEAAHRPGTFFANGSICLVSSG